MNISQIAILTGLSARQIREYEKIGLIPASVRNNSGYRSFNHKHIQRLQFIKHARDVDFSLAQIASLLALQDDPLRNNSEVKQITKQHIDNLNLKIQQLEQMKTTLQQWHDACRGDGSTDCAILNGLNHCGLTE